MWQPTESGWLHFATIGDMGTSVVRYDGSVYSWGKNSTYNVGDFHQLKELNLYRQSS